MLGEYTMVRSPGLQQFRPLLLRLKNDSSRSTVAQPLVVPIQRTITRPQSYFALLDYPEVGANRMCEVFLSEDSSLHLRAALKILPQSSAADKERRIVLNGTLRQSTMLSLLIDGVSYQLDEQR